MLIYIYIYYVPKFVKKLLKEIVSKLSKKICEKDFGTFVSFGTSYTNILFWNAKIDMNIRIITMYINILN